MKIKVRIVAIATAALWITAAAGLMLNLSGSARADDVGATSEARTKTPPPDLNGDWTGTYESSSTGESGDVTVTFDQTSGKKKFTGNYTIGPDIGSLSGSVTDKDTLKMTLKDPDDKAKCKLMVTGTIASDLSSISGSFKWSSGCREKGKTGTFELAPASS